MGLASINVKFTADLKQFSTEIQNSSRQIKKLGSDLQSAGKNLSLYVTAPIVALGTLSVVAYDKQAKAIAQVEAGLKSTKNAVGLTSDELQKLASESQNISIFGDEDILKSVTANLLTFTNIRGKVFEDAQKSVLDLSSRLGTDLQSSAIQVGKALNDPIRGITALQRVGVSFSASQKSVIANLVKTGDVAGAQAIILNELKTEFGGSAEAAAKAGTGSFKQLSNQIGDLSEEFGKIIVDALQPFVLKIKDFITYLQQLSPEAKKTIAVIAGIAAVIGPLLIAFGTIVTLIPTFLTGLTSLTAGFSSLTAIISANPLGALAVVIAAIAAGFALWYSNQQKVVSAQDSLNNAIQNGNKSATSEITTLDKLYKTSTNVKLGIDERKEAYKQLQELYPAYFKNIDFENLKNAQSVGIYKELRQAIFDKSKAAAIGNELDKRAQERLEGEIERQQKIQKIRERIIEINKGGEKQLLAEGSISKGTADVYKTKNELLATQYRFLKQIKQEQIDADALAQKEDRYLLGVKSELDQKSAKLTENEIERQKAIIAQTGVQVEAVGGLKVGTIAYYESLIALAQKAQKEVATNSTEFDLLQTKIDGYQKQIDAISKKEIKLPKPEIPNADTSFETPSLDNTLSGLKDQLAYFERLRENLSTTSAEYQAYSEVINGLKLQINGIEGVDKVNEQMDGISSKAQQMKEALDTALVQGLGDAFSSMSGKFLESLDLAETGFQGFVKGLGQTVLKLLSMYLAQSISASIAGATSAGAATGPASIFTTPAFIATAVSGVIAAFAAIPKFETGGIVGGSSFYGDRILARVNSGELILNGRQQRALFNQMERPGTNPIVLNGGWDITGDLLRLVLDRNDNKRNRRGE